MRKIGMTMLGVVLAGALLFGLWWLLWGVALANQNQQYVVNTHSQQYQQSLIEQERANLQGYDTTTDPAQQQQIALRFCAVYPDLTQPPVDLVTRQAQLCP